MTEREWVREFRQLVKKKLKRKATDDEVKRSRESYQIARQSANGIIELIFRISVLGFELSAIRDRIESPEFTGRVNNAIERMRESEKQE